MATLTDTINESFRVVPFLGVTRLQYAALAETYGLAQTEALVRGVVLTERLQYTETTAPSSISGVVVAEAFGMLAQLFAGVPVALAETVGMQQSETVLRGVQVIERAGVADAIVGAAIYKLSIAETIRVADALGRFFGASIAEGLGILEALAGQLQAPVTVSEAAGIAPALTPQLLLSVTVDEEIDLSHELALCMLYDAQMLEGVEVRALYLSPGDGFSTWAMNTRTGGVTEYSNFRFNSFADNGHTYLAAADDGLYELVGDDDAGTDIVARIKGGYLQFGGPQLSRIKAAYIAVRGGGDFVLKVHTGRDEIYHYTVTANNLETSKIHVGKGMRARYFAYELISTGQDFDLDTLEFVPIVVQRRV